MTHVQIAIPFMTVAPSAAVSPSPAGPDAEQAFLAALTDVIPLTTLPPASSVADSPAEGAPKTDLKVDIPLADGDESIAQILSTGPELLGFGKLPEATVSIETGTVPAGFLLSSTLALQTPPPSPVTATGAEFTNIRKAEFSAPPDSAPKTPPRQTLSSPAPTTPMQELPPGPPLLTPDPDPLPASSAILSNLSVSEEKPTTPPVSSDPTANPVGPVAVRNRELLVGPHATEAVHNIVFFQDIDEIPQTTVSGDPETGLSPPPPFAASNIPPPSLPGSGLPVLQHQVEKPVPLSALEYLSDRATAGIRVALGTDILSGRAGPPATKPVPSGPDVSQEESVLRAIWVGTAKDDKPAKPVQGHTPAWKDALQDGANAVTLPMSRGAPDAASPLPSQALSTDPAPAETVLSKPQTGTDNPPQVDPPPVFAGTDRVYSGQPFDPAALSVSIQTERSTASPKLDAAAPPPPPPLPPPMQIAQAINAANEQTTEILLSPEELGHVRIDIRSDGERMVMTVSAERQDTLDLLRRHADQLAAEMRAAGQAGLTLSFGRWSGSGFGAAPDGQPKGSSSAPDSDLEKLPPLLPTFRPAISASGLYLRI